MSSEKRVVAEWSERPFTDYGKRRWDVEHRVLVEHTPGVGTDVRHQVRSGDADSIPSEWTDVEIFEGRPHGLESIKRLTDNGRWWA